MPGDTKLTWEYIAGFTDGDGSVWFRLRGDGRCDCAVEWTQREQHAFVLLEIQDFLSEHGIHSTVRESYGLKVQWYLRVNRQMEVLYVLENLLPHLIVKAPKAVETIRVLNALKPHGNRMLRKVG